MMWRFAHVFYPLAMGIVAVACGQAPPQNATTFELEEYSASTKCLATEIESNNSDRNANGDLCSGVAISGKIASSSDFDWYKITLSASGDIMVSLSHDGGIDLDWYLYPANGGYVAYKSSSDNPETGSYRATTPDTYYVRVKSYKGIGKYQLTVTYPNNDPSPKPSPGPTPSPAPIPNKPCKLPNGVDLGKVGNTTPKNTATKGGFVLMGGGTDVDEAMKWMIARAGGGDFVVIRSSGTNAYNQYIYDLGGINSVQTLLIASASQGDDSCVAQTIRNAGAVFLAGGDQQNYIDYFKGKATAEALNYIINSKYAPIGGTSAGMAILSQFYHPGGAAEDESVLDNPTQVAVGDNFLKTPLLANVVTEPHFNERSRQPRLTSFMASAIFNRSTTWQKVRGIAADEATAFALDPNGIGKVFGSGSVTFVKAISAPETLSSGRPLTWNQNGKALLVYEVPGSTPGSNTFDVTTWTGTGGITYDWSVSSGSLTMRRR